jgi:hypothetical protein
VLRRDGCLSERPQRTARSAFRQRRAGGCACGLVRPPKCPISTRQADSLGPKVNLPDICRSDPRRQVSGGATAPKNAPWVRGGVALELRTVRNRASVRGNEHPPARFRVCIGQRSAGLKRKPRREWHKPSVRPRRTRTEGHVVHRRTRCWTVSSTRIAMHATGSRPATGLPGSGRGLRAMCRCIRCEQSFRRCA